MSEAINKHNRRVNSAKVMKDAGYKKAQKIIMLDAARIYKDAAGLKGV
jgi:hypothetical protein